jgi:hypothetical protein
VANITISIDPSALPGVYTLQNVTRGGKTAFIFNDTGTGFAIPASAYTVTVQPVPEPSSVRARRSRASRIAGGGAPSPRPRLSQLESAYVKYPLGVA